MKGCVKYNKLSEKNTLAKSEKKIEMKMKESRKKDERKNERTSRAQRFPIQLQDLQPKYSG